MPPSLTTINPAVLGGQPGQVLSRRKIPSIFGPDGVPNDHATRKDPPGSGLDLTWTSLCSEFAAHAEADYFTAHTRPPEKKALVKWTGDT